MPTYVPGRLFFADPRFLVPVRVVTLTPRSKELEELCVNNEREIVGEPIPEFHLFVLSRRLNRKAGAASVRDGV